MDLISNCNFLKRIFQKLKRKILGIYEVNQRKQLIQHYLKMKVLK